MPEKVLEGHHHMKIGRVAYTTANKFFESFLSQREGNFCIYTISVCFFVWPSGGVMLLEETKTLSYTQLKFVEAGD